MTLEAALSSQKALDAHMDDEFVFLAHFIRFYKERVPCKDEAVCVAWLQKLISPTRDGTSRLVRNTYLAELLVAMQSGVLGGPFAKMPPEGPLALAGLGEIGTEIGEVGEPVWLDTVINAPIPGDQQDERTYIATETHPDGRAAYAYVAVSTSTSDHDHWHRADPRDSGNESELFMTSPNNRSYGPTTCGSCCILNPIPEDIKLPCTQDQQHCWTCQ